MSPVTPPAAAPLTGAATGPTRAAADFEAMMIGELTKHMLASAPVDESFGGGHAEEMWRGMLGEQIGADIAKKGGFGLAPAILSELISMQDGRQ